MAVLWQLLHQPLPRTWYTDHHPQSDFGEYGDKDGYAGLSISGALLNNILKGDAGARRRELHTCHQQGIVASVVSLDGNFQLAKRVRVGRGKQSHEAGSEVKPPP